MSGWIPFVTQTAPAFATCQRHVPTTQRAKGTSSQRNVPKAHPHNATYQRHVPTTQRTKGTSPQRNVPKARPHNATCQRHVPTMQHAKGMSLRCNMPKARAHRKPQSIYAKSPPRRRAFMFFGMRRRWEGQRPRRSRWMSRAAVMLGAATGRLTSGWPGARRRVKLISPWVVFFLSRSI